MLCRYRKKGTKQYSFGHKVHKFSSDEWTSVNDIRLFKALQSYPYVFDTLCFFDLNPFLSIADKITFKKDLIFTSNKTIADKLNGMPYIRQQAYKPAIGEWIFKILNYSTDDLTTYQNTEKIVNILAHRDLGGIGDIIMTTSVIEEAVKKYPHYKMTYACSEEFLPLLENNPFIADLKSINSDVTKKDWDVVVDLTSDCIKHEMKNQPNVKLNRPEIFAQKCGFSIDDVPRPKIYLSEDEILRAKEELKYFKLKIGLVLKSNASVRNWPYFKELRASLSKKYPQATILEFSRKRPPYWKFIKKSYPVFERDLREVVALINECDVVISPDTGLAHIASALRVPTVWIFTHIDGKVRTKNYDNVFVCQNIPDNCESKGIPCWYDIPCSQGEIERKKNPLCSLAVKSEYVADKVNKILSKPNISYCVVYKDNEEITKECIGRILKYRKYNNELVLVDNGSKNKECLDDLLKKQQLIVRIRNEKNEGCIIARNQAMKRAKGEFLFVLDNDQYISAVSIHRLMNTEGDIVGVEGWSMDGNGWAFEIDKKYDELAYVGGGGMLVKKGIAEGIGYLDEVYAPAWFSDPDFCYTARERNYSIVYCKDARIEHLKHKTIFSQTDFDHQKAWKKNHELFREKWAGKLGINGKVKKTKETKRSKKFKILMMCDVKNWAWWYKSEYIQKYLKDGYDIELWSAQNNRKPKDIYDLYFTFSPLFLGYIKSVPRGRKVTGITSHPGFDRWFRNGNSSDYWKSVVKALHANSRFLYDNLRGCHNEVYYTPNGVDTELFSCRPPEVKQFEDLIVGFVGRLDENDSKGLKTILQPAVANLEHVRLKLNTCIYSNGASQSEMVNFYRSIDVYIVASNMDGTPNPMLEASACGRPAIANDIGNAAEFIIDGSSGFLVDRKVEDYIEKIRYFRDNRDEVVIMGNNARAQALEWDWGIKVKAYKEMFEKVLGC